MRAAVLLLVTVCIGMLSVQSASGAVVVSEDATDRGWYDEDGDHNALNTNYLAGRTPTSRIWTTKRNFFTFDLAALAGVGNKLIGAALLLDSGIVDLPENETRTYQLYTLNTSLTDLQNASTDDVAIYDDLGTGTPLGSFTFDDTMDDQMWEIQLNADALTAIRAAAGGGWAVGGSIVDVVEDETDNFAFGGTGTTSSVSQLQMTIIPEPTAMTLLALGGVAMVGRRRATRRESTVVG